MKYLSAISLHCRIHGLVLLLIVSFGMSMDAMSASADIAPSSQWTKQYERAEWVSRVRIESIGSLINPSLSREHFVAIQGYRYNAIVVDGWKGEQGGNIRFQVDVSDCQRLLSVDREYIVFGSVNYRGGLQSYRCEDLISVEDAVSLPGFLEEYSRSSRQLAGDAKS